MKDQLYLFDVWALFIWCLWADILNLYLKKNWANFIEYWIIAVFLLYIVCQWVKIILLCNLFIFQLIFFFLNSDAVNLCNLFNEKLQWTVSPHTINGWAAYNKWKCHRGLAISAWIIFKNLHSFLSAAFNLSLWFKLYSKWMAIFNYCSSVLWEIVTIVINSPYGKPLIWCPVARSSIKANFLEEKNMFISISFFMF